MLKKIPPNDLKAEHSSSRIRPKHYIHRNKGLYKHFGFENVYKKDIHQLCIFIV
jgi:hypothetical protein